MSNASLFERLGGRTGVEALVNDVVEMHRVNPVIKARFQPYFDDPELAARIPASKNHMCNFLEMGGGGRAQYTGRSMPDAHRGMKVTAAEYMAAVDDILAGLRKHGRSEETQKDVLAICWSLKGEILHI